MSKYNLGFIKDEDIYNHVKETVEKFRTSIDPDDFWKNIVDPIKLTFDSKVYGRTDNEILNEECFRQMDKSNQNQIGYFHQNIFKYAGNGWDVPKSGFDVVNERRKIYVEIKNKHNTMNKNSKKTVMEKMIKKVTTDPEATCMLVEVIATKSQDVMWGEEHNVNKRIRRVSMDKFYEIVFGDKLSFFKMCKALPIILDDVLKGNQKKETKILVCNQLVGNDFFKTLYLQAFKTYEGFNKTDSSSNTCDE